MTNWYFLAQCPAVPDSCCFGRCHIWNNTSTRYSYLVHNTSWETSRQRTFRRNRRENSKTGKRVNPVRVWAWRQSKAIKQSETEKNKASLDGQKNIWCIVPQCCWSCPMSYNISNSSSPERNGSCRWTETRVDHLFTNFFYQILF